ALTNPQHTPWQVPSRVLYRDVPCSPCYKSVCPQGHHLCLEGVPAERVVAAALALAGARRSRAAPASVVTTPRRAAPARPPAAEGTDGVAIGVTERAR